MEGAAADGSVALSMASTLSSAPALEPAGPGWRLSSTVREGNTSSARSDAPAQPDAQQGTSEASCQQARRNTVWQPDERSRELRALLETAVLVGDPRSVLLHPVDSIQYPGYYEQVRDPMFFVWMFKVRFIDRIGRVQIFIKRLLAGPRVRRVIGPNDANISVRRFLVGGWVQR